MNCLVTGSSGFIGKRLVLALRQKRHTVKEFDLSNNKSVQNKQLLAQEMQGVDIVFHLAGELDEKSPSLFESNVQGTKNAVEAAAEQHVKQFIFTSSVGVMGDIQAMADEQTPLNPKTNYEKSKAEAEKLVLSYQEVLPVTIVRPAVVAGPNKDWKKIVEMIEKNAPLIGDGSNKWQTVYVDDLVDALVFLAGNEDAFGETFIVSESTPKTLREIAEFVRKKKGMQGDLKTMPVWLARITALIAGLMGKKNFFSNEIIDRTIRLRHYSTKKINKLGWRARHSTFEALEKTIEELEQNNENKKNYAGGTKKSA